MSRRFRLLCSVSPRCLRVNLTPSLQYFYLNLRRSSGSSGDEWVILTSGDPAVLIFQCNYHENEILTDEKFRQVNALIPFSNSACSIKSIDFKSEFSPNGLTRKQVNKSRAPSFAVNYHHHQCCRPWSEKHWSGLTGPSVSQSVCLSGSNGIIKFNGLLLLFQNLPMNEERWNYFRVLAWAAFDPRFIKTTNNEMIFPLDRLSLSL